MIHFRPLVLALLAAVAALPIYAEISLLIGVGVFAIVYVAVDTERQLRSDPVPLASLLFIIACLQLIIAPCLAQYFPHRNPAYQITPSEIDAYMSYAVPLCIAVGMGLVLARAVLNWSRPVDHRLQFVDLDPVMERATWILFLASFGVMLAKSSLPVPGSIAFFVELVSEIALVCPLLMLLGRRPYWWKFALMALGWKLIMSVASTTFHSTLLWLLVYATVFWSIRFRGRHFKYALLCAALFLTVFQPAKNYLRESGERGVSNFAVILLDTVTNPDLVYDAENLSETLTRLNQGWIVNRTLTWVPEHEPHAGLSILTTQVAGALLPRFVDPEKYEVSGKELFEQYTGHKLFNASMNLGYAGEFYAAFGTVGGILAGFLYGLLLGLAFEWLRRAARSNPLWWAWAPFIFLVALKAEDTVGNALNWAVKGLVVILLVRFLFARLFKRKVVARPAAKPEMPQASPPGLNSMPRR